MKKTFYNNAKRKVYTIGVIWKPKGEKISLKSQVIPHWKSLHTMSYDKDFVHNSESFYIPMFCQIFWLWWVFYIEIHSWKLGEGRYIGENDLYDVVRKDIDSYISHIAE